MPFTDELVREIDLHAVANVLAESFPALQEVRPLRQIDTGFSSLVVETPGGLIFRIARHAAAGQAFVREHASLPLLRDHLPLPVPEIQWRVSSSPVMPYGAIGYPKLPGRPLTAEDVTNADAIATQVAGFLATLHAVEPPMLPLQIQQPHERLADWAALHAECLAALDDVLSAEEYYQVAAWWDEFLSDSVLLEFTPAVRHGDMWYGNLLTDEGGSQITGVLDFEKLAVADPAEDFAAQMELSEDFAERVLKQYLEAGGRADEALEKRARRLFEIRPFEGLLWAVKFEDTDELNDAVRKLRRSPILSTEAHPEERSH